MKSIKWCCISLAEQEKKEKERKNGGGMIERRGVCPEQLGLPLTEKVMRDHGPRLLSGIGL